FDIFWIGVSSIGPMIIAGVSLGLADLDRLRTGPERPAAARPVTGGQPVTRGSGPGGQPVTRGSGPRSGPRSLLPAR
ncbi:MAG: hypothetical protein ACRDYE_07710, partial [Acidimicrobiales bacterium]